MEELQKQADMLRQVCQPKFKITDGDFGIIQP